MLQARAESRSPAFDLEQRRHAAQEGRGKREGQAALGGVEGRTPSVARDARQIDPGDDAFRLAEAQHDGQPVVADVGEVQAIGLAENAADRVELVHHAVEQDEMIGAGGANGSAFADGRGDAGLVVGREGRQRRREARAPGAADNARHRAGAAIPASSPAAGGDRRGCGFPRRGADRPDRSACCIRPSA